MARSSPFNQGHRTWKTTLLLRGSLCAALVVSSSAPALAQQQAPPTLRVDHHHDTGQVMNEASSPGVIISFEVSQFGSDWLRLYFDQVYLGGDVQAGTGAILRITSLLDGHVQEMNATHLRQWGYSSAYFNGDTVLVEVWAKPGVEAQLVTKSFDAATAFGPVAQSICGTDDRVLSSDPRVARILPVGCTGWIVDDCKRCQLTAGHCSSGTSVLEFNVPASNPNGTLNHPGPEDQYAVDPASMQSNNGGLGVGDDWAYFGTFPNPITGLTAFEAQGAAFSLLPPPNPTGNDIRVTGYGTDISPPTSNNVQQTQVGPLVTLNGTIVGYVTDTTGGSSGSPVIWEQSGSAIAIHTDGGCLGSLGENFGTSIEHVSLQAALANPKGVCDCPEPQLLFGDDFESGNFSVGSWIVQDYKAQVRREAANTGSFGAQLKSSTSIELAVSTAGFTGVEVRYAFRTRAMESGESLTVEYFDGSSWNILESTRATNWSTVNFSDAGLSNNADMRLRFTTNAHSSNKRALIDDVEVIGILQ